MKKYTSIGNRLVYVPWTERNVSRVHRMLKLKSDFNSGFTGKYRGYKYNTTIDGRIYMVFVFFK